MQIKKRSEFILLTQERFTAIYIIIFILTNYQYSCHYSKIILLANSVEVSKFVKGPITHRLLQELRLLFL